MPAEDVSEHIEELDFPTIQALQRLKKAMVDLKRIRDINNYYVSNLLDKAFTIYESRLDGWGKVFLKTVLNAYEVASDPNAGFDKVELMRIRELLISAKEFGGDYSNIHTLLRRQYQDLQSLDSAPEGFIEEETLSLIRHFVFETYDTDGMIKELEKYYQACVNEGKIIVDGDLRFALSCLSIKGPKHWEYNGKLLSVVKNLISFFLGVEESDHYVTGMLVSLFFLKLNIEAAEKGGKPISEDDIIQLYVDYEWEHPMFQS